MSCNHPLLALNLGKQENGKYKIKILPKRADYNLRMLEERYGHDNLLLLPCGSCSGCKINHQREWAVRCSLESSYYKDNCMITLTYEDRLRPKKLIKRDLQDFIKKLRNKGLKFRYFACGEYGSKNHNCHFHIICFGYWPFDSKFEFNSDSGNPVYSSKFISDIWKRGFISVSEVTPGTCAYVAGYVDKKLGQGEFVLMSTRPGIGSRYLQEHMFDIYAYDNLVGAFGVSKVPRYFDKLAENFIDIESAKEKRLNLANLNLIGSMLEHDLKTKEEAYDLKAYENDKKISRRKRL